MDLENKCILCGGDMEQIEDKYVCTKCHHVCFDGMSKSDTTALVEAFNMLHSHDYDSAYDIFSKIVKKRPDLSIGYYGLLLSKYYVYEVLDDKVNIGAVRTQDIYSDTDYIDMMRVESNADNKQFFSSVAEHIDSESKRVMASASVDKPYQLAIYDEIDQEVYKYLEHKGYDIYASHLPSSREKVVDEFNAYTNAKVLVLCADTEDKLQEYTQSVVVNKYMDRCYLGEVDSHSLLVVSSLPQDKVLEYIPCANVLDAEKKTLLFDIESYIQSIVGKVDVVAPKVKTKKPLDKTINVKGYDTVIRGLGIATLSILLVLVFMYTFTGNHYLIIGIANVFMLGFTIATLSLSIYVYIKSTRAVRHIVIGTLSAFVILVSLIGIVSSFYTRGGADWCYRGYWYIESEDSIEVTNVDYYYTMFNRSIEVPDTIKGKDVVSFKVEYHSDIYKIVNVSERLDTLIVDTCGNLEKVVVSAMSANPATIVIKDCGDVDSIAIKHCTSLALTLEHLDDLESLILKDITRIDHMVLDGLDDLDEIWLPTTLERLAKVSIVDIEVLDIYSYSTTVSTYLHSLKNMTSLGSIEGLSGYTQYRYEANPTNN